MLSTVTLALSLHGRWKQEEGKSLHRGLKIRTEEAGQFMYRQKKTGLSCIWAIADEALHFIKEYAYKQFIN